MGKCTDQSMLACPPVEKQARRLAKHTNTPQCEQETSPSYHEYLRTVALSAAKFPPEKRDTSLPALRKTKVGSDETPYFCAASGTLSTSILTNITGGATPAPGSMKGAFSAASASNSGAIALQGPGAPNAQKCVNYTYIARMS